VDRTSSIKPSPNMRMSPTVLPCPVATSTNSDKARHPKSAAPMNRIMRDPRKNRERVTDATDPSDFATDLCAVYNGDY
jgi:hypothetical protein